MKTREEHLEWCKERARKYLDAGKPREAIASMGCDLSHDVEYFGNIDPVIMRLGLLYAQNNDLEGARRWVEGFR
jgi:hypothetical protein